MAKNKERTKKAHRSPEYHRKPRTEGRLFAHEKPEECTQYNTTGASHVGIQAPSGDAQAEVVTCKFQNDANLIGAMECFLDKKVRERTTG